MRSAYQDEQRQWIQAGWGSLNRRYPPVNGLKRREKLASVAPYLVAQARVLVIDDVQNSPP
ncbi:hypothetical protein P4S72_18730 [Vibrio sp. PP-XX7]